MAAITIRRKRILGTGGAVVVLPEGDLVAGNCAQLERCLDEVFRGPARGVAIDLSHVAYMSSAAIGVLIECVERVRDGKVWFGIVGANEAVRSSIEALGLAAYLRLTRTLAELLEKLGVSPRRRRAAPRRAPRRPPRLPR